LLKIFVTLAFIISFSVNAITLKETIEMTLKKDSGISIKYQEFNEHKGLYIQSNEQFDANLNINSSITDTTYPSSTYEGTETLNPKTVQNSFFVSKQYENGFYVENGFLIKNRLHSNQEYTQSSVFFTVNKALLKNSSEEIITADKKNAQYNMQISDYMYKNQLNNSLYLSIEAYWELLYASKKFELDRESKDETNEFMENINELIKYDMKPKADLLQAKASFNSKTISLLNSQSQLNDSKYNIGLFIGSDLEENQDMDLPIDEFPIPNTNDLKILEDTLFFKTKAIQNREDLKILDINVQKAQLGILIAKESLKSDLNLNLDLNLNINETHTISQNDDDLNSNSARLSLEYKFPIKNSLAEGLRISNEAKLLKSKIELNELKRKISYETNKLLDEMKLTIVNFKEVKTSIDDYNSALENEKIKYSMGFSTILNIIQTKDLLYFEKVKRLLILKAYSLQLLKLYMLTSTMIDDSSTFYINTNKFYTVMRE